jgi:hypothetical protein
VLGYAVAETGAGRGGPSADRRGGGGVAAAEPYWESTGALAEAATTPESHARFAALAAGPGP